MSYGPCSTANYFTISSAAVTAAPLTLACWFRVTDATSSHQLITINTTSNSDAFILFASGDISGDPVRAAARTASASAFAVSSTGYSINTWHAAAGVFTSATSRAAFIDGGSKGTNATNKTPSGVHQCGLGYNTVGSIAEMAFWSAALTDAEVLSHAKGVSPLQIRPQSLVFYAPLVRELIDYRAALTVTMTGTVAVDVHPRIYGL